MPVTVYNTMTRRKEEFIPLQQDPPTAKLYCCGPTVYNYAHIGNLRTYIFEDILRRTLVFNGYGIKHVMNITDVGHMTSDSDEGDDKMQTAAARENKSPWEIARFYEEAFFTDTDRLNIQRPEETPRATDHIVAMIALIQRLEANGYIYVTSEGVYFDTSRDEDYGKLARLQLENQRTGRDEVVADETKRNPSDFVLWFLNKPTHIMKWESPWGPGYPGWHIECSAMSMEYLGETFDIHCGGVDHIPVHHTNEIAQSECATNLPFVRYWMHGEFLLMNGGKLSKSKLAEQTADQRPKISTLQTLIDAGYDPLAYRYFCLQAHYRSELNFSLDAIDGSTSGLRKVYSLTHASDPFAADADGYATARKRVLDAINDDLGLPLAVGILNSYGSLSLWLEFDAILGLDIATRSNRPDAVLPQSALDLVERRNAARRARDWAQSDSLRNDLIALGYEVGDGPDGTTIKLRTL